MPESNSIARPGRDRPFPWHCPKCRRKEVWRVTIPYEFECQQQGVKRTVHIDALAVPRCGHCGELVIDYEADDQMRLAARTLQPPDGAPVQATDGTLPATTR